MSVLLTISQAIYSLLFIVGFVVNIFVLYVIFYILQKHQSKSPSIALRCISHLAIADLIFTLTMPMMISGLSRTGWPFGTGSCKLYLSVSFLPQFARAFLLTCLTVICYGIHSGSAYGMTPLRVSVMFTGSWILAALITIPIYLFATVTSRGPYVCNTFWPENIYANDAFVLIYLICVFLLPLAVAFVLAKKRNESPFPGEDVILIKTTMNIIFALIGAHLVLLFPHMIGMLVLNYYKTAPGHPFPVWKVNYSLLSGWIWYSSTILFPFVYHHFLDEFKEGTSYAIESIGKLRISYSKIPSPGSLFTKPSVQPV